MPLGLLELGVASFGVLGGYNLGQRIRQLVYDEDVARGKQSDSENAGGNTHLPKHARNKSLSKPSTQQNTVTVMLVGEAAVGKTLLSTRVVDGALPSANLPQTMYPAWQRADFEFASGQVIFQILDTPGRMPELAVPFYRHMDTVVLVFDVSRASTFTRMKTIWYDHLQQHRLQLPNANRYAPESCVVLANIIDERRERQVTRREAAAWAASVGLPFFETHPAEHTPKLLLHLDAIMRSKHEADEEHQQQRQHQREHAAMLAAQVPEAMTAPAVTAARMKPIV